MKMKLSAKAVMKLEKPKKGEQFIWDEELSCFAVKLTPTRSTYVVQCRIAGKTVKHSIGKVNEMSLHEARRRAMTALSNLRQGTNLNLEREMRKIKTKTLGQAFAEFKAARALRPRTVQTYDENINRCLADWLDKPLCEITKSMVDKRHQQLSNNNGPRGKGEASANQAMRLLRVIWNQAALTAEDADGKSLFLENPVKILSQTRRWNNLPKRQDVIWRHELPAWYAAVMKLTNPVMADYFLFCLFTGLRRTEAMNLKWEHINIKAKVVTIPAHLTKNHLEHQLPLTDVLIEILERRSRVRRMENAFVFPAEQGSGHIIEPKRSIESVCKTSGIKWSMHTLRRTFETIAESLAIPPYALKRLINHKMSNDVTAGYIITTTDRLRIPMQQISDHIRQALEISQPLTDAIVQSQI